MTVSFRSDAYAVLLPAFERTELSDSIKRFLEAGGCSILLGESRQEYVARRMSAQRQRTESIETIDRVVRDSVAIAGPVLVAVDQEIVGIQRLHSLVPGLPPREALPSYDTDEFEALCYRIGEAAIALGVNCFLAPIVDVVVGPNPWLAKRTWSIDPTEISRLSSAYIRGVQRAGVVATAKHFPGFHRIELDPATESEAIVVDGVGSFQPGFEAFVDAIDNDVEMVMVGPAIVEAFDPEHPASLSPIMYKMLRDDFAFSGVALSDDLDSRATLKSRTIEAVAVAGLQAGADLLLLADVDEQVDRVAEAIVRAVFAGELRADRLAEAANKIRALVKRYTLSV